MTQLDLDATLGVFLLSAPNLMKIERTGGGTSYVECVSAITVNAGDASEIIAGI